MKRNQKKNRFNSWHVLLSLFAYFWLLATMMLYGINRMNIFFRHCWADAFTLCVVYVVPVCFVSNCLTLHTTEASKCYVELKLKRQTAVSERWGMRFHSVHFIVNTMLVLMIQSDTDSTLFFHLRFIFVCITDIFYIIKRTYRSKMCWWSKSSNFQVHICIRLYIYRYTYISPSSEYSR